MKFLKLLKDYIKKRKVEQINMPKKPISKLIIPLFLALINDGLDIALGIVFPLAWILDLIWFPIMWLFIKRWAITGVIEFVPGVSFVPTWSIAVLGWWTAGGK